MRRLQASVENAQGPKLEQRSIPPRIQAQEGDERQKPRRQEARKKRRQALRRAKTRSLKYGKEWQPPRALTLEGNNVKDVPPFLSFLLSLGRKYVPHGHPHRFIKFHARCLPMRFAELRRVLVWNVFFHKQKEEGKYEEKHWRKK